MAVASTLPGVSFGFFQHRLDAGPARPVELGQAALHQAAILAQQRRQVGHGAQRHQVEQIALFEGRRRGQDRLALLRQQQRLGQLERQAHPGEVPEGVVVGLLLGVDHRQGGRQEVAPSSSSWIEW